MTPRALILTVAASLTFAAQPLAGETCRQALVLGLDVSLSVDPGEIRLQREGLAQALQDAEVRDAILSAPEDALMIAIFEWSGQHDQEVLVDWTRLDNEVALDAVSRRLVEAPRVNRTGRTAIGAAMDFAAGLMAMAGHCRTLTFDISGDGQNNSGPPPQARQAALSAAGIQINALVIEAPNKPAVAPYFERNVITRPNGFVKQAIGFEDYKAAMRRKLLRELQPAIGSLAAPVTGAGHSAGQGRPASPPAHRRD